MKKRNVSELVQNPKNPRVLKDKRFKELQKSLKEDPGFMDARPIIINKNTGDVVAGNQRLEAARSLGWEEVPVYEVALSKEESDRWNLKDNIHAGEWSFDELANHFDLDFLQDVGFDEKELEKILGKQTVEDENFDADGALEAITEPTTKTGDLWLLGPHRLLCNDSTSREDVERLMDGKKADMV